ncbi:hypothetical protein GWI33_021258 [Rhynchophorus ferrugineus]|uniref:Uncharacterized protein n=1 Tax=Rhynchophorus ferrugineus TaxID=354439 RepID=A0A834HQC3_RHYFE|nr:hypothetical protein GWI33_021258 [Rhynchophorus ferrugineus]
MIPSRSTPNLHQAKSAPGYTSTAFHRLSQRAAPASSGARDDDSPPPAPPVRDSSSLKSIKYGPGHEKFPSWPVPAAAETPSRASTGGGSSRSKSWTDHTNYPKEKVVTYTRPYMKRQSSQYNQQKLKTVMERCEKISPETFESRHQEKLPERLYLPNVDHDGKPLGDVDYMVPSPPERDFSKPNQKDLEEYSLSYDDQMKYSYEGAKEANHRLTESGIEEFMEYNRSYEESLFNSMAAKNDDGILTHIHHQKQVSYAQSEGYHSYVSSTDSSSTPFLDRLRRDSEAVVQRPNSSSTWEEESSCSRREGGRDSVVTTSSGSASSSETLKWHADRISELEKQQKYSYLDPNKKQKVPDPTLKAIQKKALLSFYERHQQNSNKSNWRSEPQLAQNQQMTVVASPKAKVSLPSRRASSASDYASANNSKRNSLASSLESKTTDNIGNGMVSPRHQHSNSCGSLSTDLLGPVIVGPSISIDDYVPEKPPERPPKNPNLRNAFPDLFQDQRVPSPDLPPPSPPTVLEHEVFDNDTPLPPPPPECESDWHQQFSDRLKENATSGHQIPQPQVQKSVVESKKSPLNQTVGIPERPVRYSLIKTRPGDHIIQQVSSKPYQALPEPKGAKTEHGFGFPNQRGYAERSSTRYPSSQKLVINGSIAVSQKVNGMSDQHRSEQLKPIHREDYKKHSIPPSTKPESHKHQRSSIAESQVKDTPPPLQPRHMRINQSMRAKISHDHRSRMSPPKEGMRESRSASL